jgi:GntR family transcriptional regulator
MNRHSPKYVSLSHSIKSDILSGVYKTGDYLPPEGDLMKLFNASRTTVRRAIAILKSENLVDVRQGRGTEVLSSGGIQTPFNLQSSYQLTNLSIANKYLVAGEPEITTQHAVIDQMLAEKKVANALGIGVGTEVYRLQHVKLVKNVIYTYVTSYIPCTVLPGLEQYNGKILHFYNFMKETYGVPIVRVEDAVSAIRCGFLEGKLLNVSPGSPLLFIRRIAFGETSPIEYAEKLIRPDLYELVVLMNRPTQDEFNEDVVQAIPEIGTLA